jgi:hypothetical protein
MFLRFRFLVTSFRLLTSKAFLGLALSAILSALSVGNASAGMIVSLGDTVDANWRANTNAMSLEDFDSYSKQSQKFRLPAFEVAFDSLVESDRSDSFSFDMISSGPIYTARTPKNFGGANRGDGVLLR